MIKRIRWVAWALLLSCALMLSGCLDRSAGGALSRQGTAALERKDYNTALADFQQAIVNGEDEVVAYRGQGIAMMGLAQYTQAAGSFETALSYTDSRMPETVRDIRLYLASARFREGNYEELVAVCEELLEEEELTEGHFYLGAAYLHMDEIDEAKSEFDQAVALSPKDYQLYLQIYEQYADMNRTATGDEYLQQALQIPAESSEDAYHLGQIYYYLEQYEQAQLVLSDPAAEKYIPAMQLLGEVYLAQEDYSHAHSIYQSIRDENGESSLVYNGLTLCAIASGEYSLALEYITAGLAIEDESEEEDAQQSLRFNEIIVYEKLLDFQTALVKAESYYALYPTDEAGHRELVFLRTRGQ